MKKPANKKKKKRSGRKRSQTDSGTPPQTDAGTPAPKAEEQDGEKAEAKKVAVAPTPKREVDKRAEKKKEEKRSIKDYVSMAVQFFREARVELKKVKWPTRKELLASTAMVILLVLIAALYLGVIDFGLIKIIRIVVG